MARTAFVTGATGFVGLNLVEALAREGWRVLALHRPESDLKHLARLPAERVLGDVTDRALLERALPTGVDAVFHAAGDTSLWSRRNAHQDLVNIEGTRNMVEAALARRARRFVHTSSISAYGMVSGRIDERTEQRGGESWVNYQRSKFLGEREVRGALARGLDAVILNPAGIIGPYDTRNWARMIRFACAGKLPGVPPGASSFCHVREVARAHIAAVERGRRGESYLLGGADASFLELVRTIGEVTGCKVPARPLPAWLLRALARLAQWTSYATGRAPTLSPEAVALATRRITCDCTKAERELGFRPVPLRAMVEDSVAWLEREGLLGRPAARAG
ncbi:MAG: SDR family oxidoreductase [Betaproteobacteria bacterium]|nr:SDR family oxidoreductase [Betaproteobacteria bacterium]